MIDTQLFKIHLKKQLCREKKYSASDQWMVYFMGASGREGRRIMDWKQKIKLKRMFKKFFKNINVTNVIVVKSFSYEFISDNFNSYI